VAGSEGTGEFVEKIPIQPGGKAMGLLLVSPEFSGEALSALMGLSTGSVDGDGAMY
jgi:hypothetical protein